MMVELTRPPLPREFYGRDVVDVARNLLGKVLIRRSRQGATAGRIIETEAYLSKDDSACHAATGRTGKNNTMFGRPGQAYVYSIHARYCLNAVTQPAGEASAVLIRAAEPLHGLELMQQRRGREKLNELCRGPARLCEAFAIDRSLDNWDLTCGQRLWIAAETEVSQLVEVGVSARIGVTSAEDLLLRFFVKNNDLVSGSRKLNGRTTT